MLLQASRRGFQLLNVVMLRWSDLSPREHESSGPPFIVGKISGHKFEDVIHIAASESEALSLVAKSPGGKVGISIEFCCAVQILTILGVISGDCANGPSGDPSG